jgi:hypothetical protein
MDVCGSSWKSGNPESRNPEISKKNGWTCWEPGRERLREN